MSHLCGNNAKHKRQLLAFNINGQATCKRNWPQTLNTWCCLNLPVSQLAPSKPVPAQLQEYWFTPFVQTPPFWQGVVLHSLMSRRVWISYVKVLFLNIVFKMSSAQLKEVKLFVKDLHISHNLLIWVMINQSAFNLCTPHECLFQQRISVNLFYVKTFMLC